MNYPAIICGYQTYRPFDGSIEKAGRKNYQRVNSGEGIVQLVNTKKLRKILRTG